MWGHGTVKAVGKKNKQAPKRVADSLVLAAVLSFACAGPAWAEAIGFTALPVFLPTIAALAGLGLAAYCYQKMRGLNASLQVAKRHLGEVEHQLNESQSA